MSKASPQDLKDLGFVFDMFDKTDDAAFVIYLQAVLDEITIDLADRVDSSTYGSTTEPTRSYVKRAEKYLAASELWTRRANIILKSPGNLEHKLAASEEKKQAKDYATSAEQMLERLTSGDGISAASSVTSHFVESS